MFVFTDILGRSNTGRNFLDYTAESGTLKRSRLIFKLRPAAQAQQLASLAKSERCWDDSLGPTSRAMNAFRRWWRCLKKLSIWNRGRASGDAEKIVSSYAVIWIMHLPTRICSTLLFLLAQLPPQILIKRPAQITSTHCPILSNSVCQGLRQSFEEHGLQKNASIAPSGVDTGEASHLDYKPPRAEATEIWKRCNLM